MIRDRAMSIHGRVCCVEQRGPRVSLILDVWDGWHGSSASAFIGKRGTHYEIRRGVLDRRKPEQRFSHFVPWSMA